MAEKKRLKTEREFLELYHSPIEPEDHRVDKLMPGVLKRFEQIHLGSIVPADIKSGFPSLDSILNGFRNGQFVVIEGKQSQGKTALVFDIARHVALRTRKTVAIFSAEMDREQIVTRLVAAESGTTLWRICSGQVRKEGDFDKIEDAMKGIAATPIYVFGPSMDEMLTLYTIARELKEKNNLSLLIIDRALWQPKTDIDEQRKVAQGFKLMAEILEVPILVTHTIIDSNNEDTSLSRFSDTRIRICQTDEPDIKEVVVVKNKYGVLGFMKLQLNSDAVSFHEIETGSKLKTSSNH